MATWRKCCNFIIRQTVGLLPDGSKLGQECLYLGNYQSQNRPVFSGEVKYELNKTTTINTNYYNFGVQSQSLYNTNSGGWQDVSYGNLNSLRETTFVWVLESSDPNGLGYNYDTGTNSNIIFNEGICDLKKGCWKTSYRYSSNANNVYVSGSFLFGNPIFYQTLWNDGKQLLDINIKNALQGIYGGSSIITIKDYPLAAQIEITIDNAYEIFAPKEIWLEELGAYTRLSFTACK